MNNIYFQNVFDDYKSLAELMFNDRELCTIIAMTKNFDETDPNIKRLVRKCHKLLEHKDTQFIGA